LRPSLSSPLKHQANTHKKTAAALFPFPNGAASSGKHIFQEPFFLYLTLIFKSLHLTDFLKPKSTILFFILKKVQSAKANLVFLFGWFELVLVWWWT